MRRDFGAVAGTNCSCSMTEESCSRLGGGVCYSWAV
jgi:hypothetical protein